MPQRPAGRLGPPGTSAAAKFRAARRLEDLGLIEYANQRYGPRGVWIELTPLGAEVVDRYHHELESGLRIRWPQEEN